MPWDGAPLWVSGAQADPLQLGCAAGVEGKCAGDPLQGSTVLLWGAQGACRETRWQLYPNHNGSWWVLLRQLYIFPIIGSMWLRLS